MFAMSPYKRNYDEALATLKNFTKNVILKKRAQFEASIGDDTPKGRVAFLDLLLQAKLPDGSKLTDADIQEEVVS